ncbi:AraC family transcriptional regulator [Gilvimarinus polysaccharolyticus]|uniref:AraC family transcriptional regulator n=1 Tax=Gilvimarinus polysaccharolyticus TaxID=863921 RepID=UPI0006732D7E|nr:AraC family transcriptional regulator [Gilvimarinus polysaccharolyticus]
MSQFLFNIHEVVLFITAMEALFLASGILLIPRYRLQSHWLLAGLLVLVAIILAATLIIWHRSLQIGRFSDSISIPALLTFSLLLQGPLLYGVMASFTQPLMLTSWRVALHLAPALLGASLIGLMGVTVADWLPWNWQHLPESKQQIILLIWAAFKCSPLIYAVLCCAAEYRLRCQLRQHYASLPLLELRWAELLLGGFTLHWLWVFIAYWLSGYVSGTVNDMMGLISNYVTVLLINALFVFALFSGRKALMLSDAGSQRGDAINQVEKKLARIARAISIDKLHLDPHINLERFAELCNIKPRELSSLVNSHHHKNFFEFVNYYRVEEVKRLLETDYGMTILETALAAGFNSQSAFQRFFKRLVGMTPSEYRRRHRADIAKLEPSIQ